MTSCLNKSIVSVALTFCSLILFSCNVEKEHCSIISRKLGDCIILYIHIVLDSNVQTSFVIQMTISHQHCHCQEDFVC